MELVFRVTALNFSADADYANPTATVRVQPDEVEPWNRAWFELRLPLSACIHPANASDPAAFGHAALERARSLVRADVAQEFLTGIQAREARLRGEGAAAMAAAFSGPGPSA